MATTFLEIPNKPDFVWLPFQSQQVRLRRFKYLGTHWGDVFVLLGNQQQPTRTPAGSHAAMHAPPNVILKPFCALFCLPDESTSIWVHFGDQCVWGFKQGVWVFCIHSAGSAEFRLHRLLAYLTALLSSLISPVNAGLQLIENELASVSLQCLL